MRSGQRHALGSVRRVTNSDPSLLRQGSAGPSLVQRLAAYGIARQDGAVLLVRSSDRSDFPGWWSLPGGGVDHGEHPLDTVVRELREETGLTVQVTGTPRLHSHVLDLQAGTVCQHSVRVVVDVEVLAGTLTDETDGTTDHVQWVPVARFDALQLMPFTREALSQPAPRNLS